MADSGPTHNQPITSDGPTVNVSVQDQSNDQFPVEIVVSSVALLVLLIVIPIIVGVIICKCVKRKHHIKPYLVRRKAGEFNYNDIRIIVG